MNNSENFNKKNKSFTLFNNETGESFEIPVLSGTDGPNVLDIRSLFKETGMFTYDPGFTSTASCDSSITYIDGDKGILCHRGYNIKELAMKRHHVHKMTRVHNIIGAKRVLTPAFQPVFPGSII